MNRRKTRGFTLIELQLSLFIALVTFVAAISLYIFYWRTFIIGNTVVDVYSNSRIAMELMGRDIRWAAQVVPSHSPYTTTDSCIVLQVPAIDSSNNTIPSHYDYITYMLQGSDLYRIVQKDSLSSRLNENRAVAHDCTLLTFSSGGVGLGSIPNLSTVNVVAVYLPINKATLSLSGAGTETASLNPTTVIRLRNK